MVYYSPEYPVLNKVFCTVNKPLYIQRLPPFVNREGNRANYVL